MKIKFNTELEDIKLGMDRRAVNRRVFDFAKARDLEVKVSQHNLAIMQPEFRCDLRSGFVAFVTFDDSKKLVAINIKDVETAGFDVVEFHDGVRLQTSAEIIDFIRSGENVEISCRCPKLERELFMEEIVEMEKNGAPECGTTQFGSCIECKYRSQLIGTASYKKYGICIQYDMDCGALLMIDDTYGWDVYDQFWYIDDEGNTEID